MEEKKYKLGTNLAAILTFSAICSFCGCSPQTGVRSGQVLNAVTNEPIQGAIVCFDWHFGGVFGLGPIGGKSYETSTDKDGEYYMPSQTISKPNFMCGNLDEQVLIYKDGYAAYIVDLSRIDSVYKPFGYPDDNQSYHERNNIVELYPWKEGESHYHHLNCINNVTFYGEGELLKKELEPEKKRAREELAKDVEAGRKRAEQERAKQQTQK
jgi:hypothetical protein